MCLHRDCYAGSSLEPLLPPLVAVRDVEAGEALCTDYACLDSYVDHWSDRGALDNTVPHARGPPGGRGAAAWHVRGYAWRVSVIVVAHMSSCCGVATHGMCKRRDPTHAEASSDNTTITIDVCLCGAKGCRKWIRQYGKDAGDQRREKERAEAAHYVW